MDNPDIPLNPIAFSAAETSETNLRLAGYDADFSFESLKEVDRLIDEQAIDGEAIRGGYFDLIHLPEHNLAQVRTTTGGPAERLA